MSREMIVKHFLPLLKSTLYEIESLEEFYYRSFKTVEDYSNELKKECSIGIRISEIFDKLLEDKNLDTIHERVKDAGDLRINDSQLLKDFCSFEYSEEKKTILYSMNSNSKYSPNEASIKMENVTKYKKILVESVISHIMIVYEFFLSSIFRIVLGKNPLKYIGNNQTVELSSIIKHGIGAISSKLDEIVDNALRNSLDLTKLIIEKESISLDRQEELIKVFTEIYYRRNAYIHTSGCVNKDYLSKVDGEFTKGKEIGSFLICNDEYLDNAINTLIKMVFTLSFELMKKEDINDDEVNEVANYFFERMKNQQYELSKYVYKALSKYENLQFISKTMYHINYLNSCKQLNEKELVKQEIESMDVSAMQDMFVIAKACLEDRSKIVLELLNKTYPKSFSANAIRDWPIFIDFRKTNEYKQFVEAHKEDFRVEEFSMINAKNEGEFGEEKLDITNCHS